MDISDNPDNVRHLRPVPPDPSEQAPEGDAGDEDWRLVLPGPLVRDMLEAGVTDGKGAQEYMEKKIEEDVARKAGQLAAEGLTVVKPEESDESDS